jgi:hypothetical protein
MDSAKIYCPQYERFGENFGRMLVVAGRGIK